MAKKPAKDTARNVLDQIKSDKEHISECGNTRTLKVADAGYSRRFKNAFQEQEKLLQTWRNIARFVCPERGSLYGLRPNDPGSNKNKPLVDYHAVESLGRLQSGIYGNLTSPSKRWFALTLDHPEIAKEQEVIDWCTSAGDVVQGIMQQSNIYNVLHGFYGEVGGFGIGAMIVEEDPDDVIHGTLFTAGEWAVEFGPNDKPVMFCRKLWMTADNIVERFGEDTPPDSVKTAIANNDNGKWFEVHHLICRDKDHVTGKPFMSMYWTGNGDHSLGLAGYYEFPVMVARWDVAAQNTYGYGPGLFAMPESKMLQILREDYLNAQKMAIMPPIILPADAAEQQANLVPGGIVYSSSENIAARSLYNVQPDVRGQLEAMQQAYNKIDRALYADLFLLISREYKDMTATEVAAREQEKLQILGPVVERLENELLNPLIGRIFNILARKGRIPEPPEILAGMNVHIEYVSALALAQRASSTVAINGAIDLTARIAGLDPQVIDKLDGDRTLDEIVALTNIPGSIIRNTKEVEALRAQRAQQQQAMMQQQQMAQEAQVALQAGKAAQAGAGSLRSLAQAQAQGGNSMEMLFGEQGVAHQE